jgi:hypothetical protein
VFTTPPALLFAVLASAAAAFLLQSPAATAAQGRTADDFQSSVARLDLTQGSVAFQPAGGGDNGWVAAVVDRTLKIGDQLWADSDGAVEMHVGSAAVRMGHNTGVSFLNLSENLTQLQVSAGSVIVRLDKLDPDDAFEVTAPNLLIALLQPGTYEIDANPETHVTGVTVIAGEGQVTGGGQSWSIAPRQQATFSGMDTLTYSIKDAKSFPQTDFEKWSAQLDVNANGAAAEHTTGSSQAPPPILQALPEADWQTTAGGQTVIRFRLCEAEQIARHSGIQYGFRPGINFQSDRRGFRGDELDVARLSAIRVQAEPIPASGDAGQCSEMGDH